MSSTTTPSPLQRPQADESQLPAGHCRYIMLMPEIKGQRCGCAHFNLNRNIPGTTCECGHLSCYHLSNGEPPSTAENQELAIIRQRLEQLEREQLEFQQLRRDFREFNLFREHLRERSAHDNDRHQQMVVRVSELEESVERGRIDVNHEVREAYRNLGRAWDSITDLTAHKDQTNAHLRQIDDHLQNIDDEVAHIGDRQLELVDVDIGIEDRIETIEDRVEVLESIEGVDPADAPGSESASTPRATRTMAPPSNTATNTSALPSAHPLPARSRSESPAFTLDTPAPRASVPSLFAPALSNAIAAAAAAPVTASATSTSYGRELSPIRARSIPLTMPASAPRPLSAIVVRPAATPYHSTASPPSSELWTVHVSLLPTSTQPFPFERDTNAYKRCLSRGLHQMVAVNGTSADAFEEAIQRAFGKTLRGRRWAPLQALPCTAERLAGLPMLRPLDPSLVDERCSLDFLRNHCAVCDSNGKIDSLYIAMRDKTLSWHSIRRLPTFLEGLEPCWNYDVLLDQNDREEDFLEVDSSSSEDEVARRPPAGDIVATLPSLKRAASQISRSSSFGSASGAPPASASASANTSTSNAAATSQPEAEGSRPKVARMYPLPNADARRSVKTL